MWKMINQSNAVEGMALTIRFGEPVNSLVAKRVIAALESIAPSEGFIDKQPLQQIQIDVASQAVRQTATAGISFQHVSVERNNFGIVEQTLSRQLIFQPEQIILQINRYRSWEKERVAAQKFFRAALDILAVVVPIQALRLEYLNRFVFEGSPESVSVSALLKESELVSSIGLKSNNLWHSHSGRFDQQDEFSRRLIQINADMQDLASNHPLSGNRTLALMLAVERQFMKTQDGDEVTSSKVDDYFNALHDDIHTLFKQLIDSKFASSNRLPA